MLSPKMEETMIKSLDSSEIALSIIVPAYNVEAYLVRCLDSIVCQLTDQIEVIVINDRSPGNCEEIIKIYQQKYHNIHYLRHKTNRSLMQSRITGIKNAKGRFVLHIDGDDALSETVCAEILRIIEDPEVDMIQYYIHAGVTLDAMDPTWHNPPEGILSVEEIRKTFYEGKLWWPLCGKAFSARLSKQALHYYPKENVHINSNEDMILFTPLLFLSKKCVVTHSCKYYYFNNPSSLTKQNIYSDPHKWEKITSDMQIARKEVLKFINTINAQDHTENMEKIMHANFIWLEKNIRKLPDKLYKQRLTSLISLANPTLAYETLLNYSFHALCAAAAKIQPKRRNTFKHIAVFTNMIGLGGAERVAAILCRYFVEDGYRVTLFTNEHPQYTDYPYPETATRHVLPSNQVERHTIINSTISIENIDVCIMVSNHTRPTLYDLVSCRFAGSYIIAMEHSMFFYPSHAKRNELFSLRQSAYSLAHVITCLSDEITHWWHAAGYPQAVHIPNPLTFDTPNIDLKPYRQRRPNILFISKLTAFKGAFHLPHILYEIRKNIPEATLTILGRNVLTEKENKLFCEILDDYVLRDAILMPGHIQDISEYCKHAMAFILPSRLEGAPMSLMEAKHHGVPAVLYSMEYLANTTEDDGCIFVPKEDVSAMSKAVIRLLQDETYWTNMSKAALNSLRFYSKENIIKKWKLLFDNLENASFPEEIYPMKYDSQEMFRLTMKEFCYSVKRWSSE
jgi:glycosyltransferase involved in cell wall biosynthesis